MIYDCCTVVLEPDFFLPQTENVFNFVKLQRLRCYYSSVYIAESFPTPLQTSPTYTANTSDARNLRTVLFNFSLLFAHETKQ